MTISFCAGGVGDGDAVGLVGGGVVSSPPHPGMRVIKNTRLIISGKAYLIDFFHMYK
jgi:hypothetical protein